MNKTHGLCCIALGAALLIAALSLVFYNLDQNKKSGEAAQAVLNELKEVIPEPVVTSAVTTRNSFFAEYETTTEPVMEEPTVIVEDHGYIGVIRIPSLGIELPVMSEWSYPNLKLSPCRYKGSAAEKNMIIAAHNYRSHFGRLTELSGGEEIIFTDMNGKVYTYEVAQTIEINGRDIEQMDFGSGELWDLTLFTCTLGGQSRVTVRAVEMEE